MRRTVLLTLGMLPLALGMRLAFPPDAAEASSSKIIYSFVGGADGAYPESDLIVDAAGNLYGTTNRGGTGCGTVFELTRTKDGWTHQVLYSFGNASSDGCGPTAGLVFDSAGNLYGTTAGGGSSGSGTVFKLAGNSHGGWTESILYSFTGSNGDGASPNTDLVFDSQGNLYGTTSGGGQNYRGGCYSGCGIVFRLTPNSNGTWTESTIYAFAGVPDGGNPASSVVLDANENIYGTTAYGGTQTCDKGGHFSGCGSLYKLTPNSGGGWTETLPYNFHRFQGTARNPSGGLLFTADGQILGSSSIGGDGIGAVFKLEETKKGWEQTVLYRFYGPDGAYPVGRLAVGPNGKFYGATAGGGMNSYRYNGTVFELEQTIAGWRERVLLSANGFAYNPQAGPTVDSQGRVYGTFANSNNGSNFGAVYEIIP